MTEVLQETATVDGWTTIYETKTMKTYDSAGNLLSSQSVGPTEVDKYRDYSGNDTTTVPEANPDAKAKDLAAEVARVTPKVNYATGVSSELANLMNAQRANAGLSTLQMTDTAMSIAKLRAADMCIYDADSTSLPTYGSLVEMLTFYEVSSAAPNENLWKTQSRSADEINKRLQTIDSARNSRMNESATAYGVAIVEKNGAMYICEIFL